MATAGIQFRIMPTGIDVDLDELKGKIKTTIESFPSGVFNNAEEQPIAFGLKALIITLALSEDEESDLLENALGKLENVSSIEMIDYRRAVG